MIINLVGCDGCGKTTQIHLIKPWLEKTYNLPVRVVAKRDICDFERFPECRFLGCSYKELMYQILPQMQGESRSLFLYYMFATSMCHYPPQDDEVMILDGYWYKHCATETALGIDYNWLWSLGSFFPKPDISIFLEIEPKIIVERRRQFNDSHAPYECGCTSDCSDAAFLEQMDKVFVILKNMAVSENWNVIDARGAKEDIFEKLKLIVSASKLRVS
jgi:dTMP kinase